MVDINPTIIRNYFKYRLKAPRKYLRYTADERHILLVKA